MCRKPCPRRDIDGHTKYAALLGLVQRGSSEQGVLVGSEVLPAVGSVARSAAGNANQ